MNKKNQCNRQRRTIWQFTRNLLLDQSIYFVHHNTIDIHILRILFGKFTNWMTLGHTLHSFLIFSLFFFFFILNFSFCSIWYAKWLTFFRHASHSLFFIVPLVGWIPDQFHRTHDTSCLHRFHANIQFLNILLLFCQNLSIPIQNNNNTNRTNLNQHR